MNSHHASLACSTPLSRRKYRRFLLSNFYYADAVCFSLAACRCRPVDKEGRKESEQAEPMDDDCGEDVCFCCKEVGDLYICDFKNCRKAYHCKCVQKDESFMVDSNKWECPWHSCSICNNKAVFQCYCCPSSSVCRACVKEAEFAPVRNSNKGFCRMCLRLAILIEEDREKADSDDPKHHFRDYWYITKHSESLSLSDLKAAKRRFEQTGGGNETISEDYEPEPELDSSTSFLPEEELRKRKSQAKLKVNSLSNKKCRSKGRNFIKWGSEELIDFLVSVGRNADVSLSQGDVERVVKDYIEKNNLYEPEKKKKFVLCDDMLRALFRKRRIKFNRIYKLLEEHFPGSQGDIILFDSDDEIEEEAVAMKKRKLDWEPSHMQDAGSLWERIMAEKKSCTAALVRENIKSIYLRQSLVLQFLKNPGTFEQKVMGCFVRVKHHREEFYVLPPNLYQIGQITGVKKDTDIYQVGGMSTDIVIRISNFHKDIKLSSLADDDFRDEDVEDLCKLVQKGHYKMPTVGEVAEKLKCVHEDITSHWIQKELGRLTKLKQLAYEKGWRKEMFDHIDRIKVLSTPDEQERLKKEMPLILADSEGEKNEKRVVEEEKGVATITSSSNSSAQNAKAEVNHQKPASAGGENGRNRDNIARRPETNGEQSIRAFCNAEDRKETLTGNDASAISAEELHSKERAEVVMAVNSGNELKEQPTEVKLLESLKSDSSNGKIAREPNIETPTQNPIQPTKDTKPEGAVKQIIDILDSDSEESASSQIPGVDEEVWYYMDPQGNIQGAFSMSMLRKWGQKGYFDKDFKVWRKGQSIQDAVLLCDISRRFLP